MIYNEAIWGSVLNKTRYEKLKSNKPFSVGDIYIYLGLILVIFALFLSIIIIPNSKKTDGFVIYKGEKKILTYYYENDLEKIEDDFLALVQIENADNGKLISIFSDSEKTEYNIVFVNSKEQTVKMHDSTCSISKDCTISPKISNSGMIYCAPHEIKIVPLNNENNLPLWTGGA